MSFGSATINRNMRTGIILATVAIVGMVGLASATELNQFYQVERTERLNHGQLKDALSFDIRCSSDVCPPEAQKVVNLLAETGEKDVIYPRFKHSINDLLKLNEWTTDDCNDAEFEKRRQMCTPFFKDSESFESESTREGIWSQTDLIHYNLGKYCRTMVNLLVDVCKE